MSYTMLRKRLNVLLGLLAFVFVLSIGVVQAMVTSQTGAMVMGTAVNPDLPHREISLNTESPNISFINSPSPTCHRPVAGTNACYVEWSYLSVTASPGQYIISMTVTIDDRVRAYHAGFFQTSMYIPGTMTAPGYRLACGEAESGGVPGLGSTYSYVISARETSGLTATNYGSVTCPADMIKLYLPAIQRP